MKILVSTSMPELIPDTEFDLDVPETRLDMLKKLMDKSSAKKVGEFKGMSLYKTGDDQQSGYWFLINSAGDDLAYVCKFVTLGASSLHFKSKVVTQVAVWRNLDIYLTRKFPTYIFFNMLLPKYGVVMTDSQQTRAGRTFWQARIGDAIHKNLYVYTFDQNTRELQRLHNTDDLDNAAPYIWARDPKFRTRRVLISQTPLTLE